MQPEFIVLFGSIYGGKALLFSVNKNMTVKISQLNNVLSVNPSPRDIELRTQSELKVPSLSKVDKVFFILPNKEKTKINTKLMP